MSGALGSVYLCKAIFRKSLRAAAGIWKSMTLEPGVAGSNDARFLADTDFPYRKFISETGLTLGVIHTKNAPAKEWFLGFHLLAVDATASRQIAQTHCLLVSSGCLCHLWGR